MLFEWIPDGIISNLLYVLKLLLFLIAYVISSFKILRFAKALIQLPSKAKQNWTVIRNWFILMSALKLHANTLIDLHRMALLPSLDRIVGPIRNRAKGALTSHLWPAIAILSAQLYSLQIEHAPMQIIDKDMGEFQEPPILIQDIRLADKKYYQWLAINSIPQ